MRNFIDILNESAGVTRVETSEAPYSFFKFLEESKTNEAITPTPRPAFGKRKAPPMAPTETPPAPAAAEPDHNMHDAIDAAAQALAWAGTHDPREILQQIAQEYGVDYGALADAARQFTKAGLANR